jgi:hypothetical protein
MAIDANPEADLVTLAEFDIPILSGPDYSAYGKTILASAQVPITSPGPGGVQFLPTLSLAASLLTEFATVIKTLDFQAQQQIAQAIGLEPAMSLQSVINIEISYLSYLQTRDANLLGALTGIMNLTK